MSDTNTAEEPQAQSSDAEALEQERYALLHRLDDWMETPMLVLSFVWLALVVLELSRGESPLFSVLGTVIWAVFIVDFSVKLVLAPHRVAYLKRNWLVAISLLLPALRVFRVFRVFRLLRVARAGRGLRLVRVVSSLNRGMKALGASLSRRGFGYVITLSVLVTFGGAAGMYAFESGSPGGPASYSEALWWTAMIMTTMGSEFWPLTAEGRALCLMLALYAFGVFGYVTAALATFFVGRDAENVDAEMAGANQMASLEREVAALRQDIRALSAAVGRAPRLPG